MGAGVEAARLCGDVLKTYLEGVVVSVGHVEGEDGDIRLQQGPASDAVVGMEADPGSTELLRRGDREKEERRERRHAET